MRKVDEAQSCMLMRSSKTIWSMSPDDAWCYVVVDKGIGVKVAAS